MREGIVTIYKPADEMTIGLNAGWVYAPEPGSPLEPVLALAANDAGAGCLLGTRAKTELQTPSDELCSIGPMGEANVIRIEEESELVEENGVGKKVVHTNKK